MSTERLIAFALLAATGSAVAQPEAGSKSATSCNRLYAFGDSYSDTGYGYLDGNGPTAIAYAAHDLGLNLLPASLGQPADSLNYAVSGATTGKDGGRTFGRALLGFGILNQVDAFAKDVTDGRAKFDSALTVFFLAGGLNDANLSTEQTIDNIGLQVDTLHQAGARRFVIALLPITIAAFTVGKRLNPSLPGTVAVFRTKYPDSIFDLSDWGPMFDRVHAERGRRGFAVSNARCAGRLIFGQDATPCRNPRASFFYHDDHPSTEAHRQVGLLLAAEARGNWCSRTGPG